MFILFSIILLVFIFFGSIPSLYKYVFVYKVSHVSFKNSDEKFEFTSFDISKLFIDKARYSVAKSDIANKYSLKYDDFLTRSVSSDGEVAIVAKTRKKIQNADLESISILIADELHGVALNLSSRMFSDGDTTVNGRFVPLSISEFNNLNMKRKGPIVISSLIILFYFVIFSSFIRNAFKK